jgi:hypothetical protein
MQSIKTVPANAPKTRLLISRFKLIGLLGFIVSLGCALIRLSKKGLIQWSDCDCDNSRDPGFVFAFGIYGHPMKRPRQGKGNALKKIHHLCRCC